MALLLFWIKVILKRILEFIKISPVTIIGGIIILSALIYTNTNIQVTLNGSKFIITFSALIIIPIMMSLKEYSVLEKITFYAKSNYSNRLLRYIFFVKKSLLNNILMILFFILIFSNRIIVDFSFNIWKTLCIFPFSIFLSLLVMILRNNGRKINKTKNIMHINSVIKSTLYDYRDSVLMAIIIIAVSLFICIELFMYKNILNEMTEPVFIPLILFILLSIGFIGLSDSVIKTNWLFYTVVSLDFRYHFKRTVLFILSFYGIVLLQYIIIVMYLDITLLLIYLFAIISTMLLAMGIVYLRGNILKKIIVYALYIRLVVYILYVSPYIMLVSIFPALIALVMAKNDFIERGYL
ncbi:MAG: hypothetical protein LBK43_05155 [Treponema sp.]|jgi:hypothetical protein|nr:hypothetical protein [Treponema sp.]